MRGDIVVTSFFLNTLEIICLQYFCSYSCAEKYGYYSIVHGYVCIANSLAHGRTRTVCQVDVCVYEHVIMGGICFEDLFNQILEPF